MMRFALDIYVKIGGNTLSALRARHACKLGFEGIVSKRLGSP
jgi:ATP-dependent DNA ligase